MSSGGNGWPGDRNLDRARIGHVEAGSVRGAALDLQAVEARGLDRRAEVVVGRRNRVAARPPRCDRRWRCRRSSYTCAPSVDGPSCTQCRAAVRQAHRAAAADPAPAPPAGSAARSCSRRPERSRRHRSLPRRWRRRSAAEPRRRRRRVVGPAARGEGTGGEHRGDETVRRDHIAATIGPSSVHVVGIHTDPTIRRHPDLPAAAGSNVGAMSKPLGPYTPVVRAGDFIVVSGQGGMADGVVVDGGVAAETTQTMKNVAAQLATVGAELDRHRQDDVLPHRHGELRRVQRRVRRSARRPSPGAVDGGGGRPPGRLPRRGRGLGVQAPVMPGPDATVSHEPVRCAWALGGGRRSERPTSTTTTPSGASPSTTSGPCSSS